LDILGLFLMRIHWCGTGRSSGPGLRRLLQDGQPVTVWTEPIDQGQRLVGDLTADIRPYVLSELDADLARGDIVVSMLPAHLHADLARHCVGHGAHFLWPGYITPELSEMDSAARRAGSALIGEIGLDPGIDHLMAHDLVNAYRTSPSYRGDNVLSFQSLCGGFPVEPGPFRYKFGWSPLGVLRTLCTPARYRRDFVDLMLAHPWDGLHETLVPFPHPQTFEAFPNRDSLPYRDHYLFDPAWNVRDFYRGNLRPLGWGAAWQAVFDQIADLPKEPAAREKALQDLAQRLGADHPYAKDEPDRVVLEVSLRAESEGRPVWHQSWLLDAEGDLRGSAMARLVSGPLVLMIDLVQNREMPVGVHPAPHEPRLVKRLLDQIAPLAQTCHRIDHLR